jgi:hypothetical protein
MATMLFRNALIVYLKRMPSLSISLSVIVVSLLAPIATDAVFYNVASTMHLVIKRIV